ncbi:MULTISPECIES: hypothetical protein [Streptomyces]|uniref:Uncharacterized protein n=1 Tax=Streptomyces sp. 900129855 TaxID=3155129 RepID=A0ABV2ZGC2_9ACTN
MTREDPRDGCDPSGGVATNCKELMTVSIIHALLRWVLGVLVPGTGKRRAAHPRAASAATLGAAQLRANRAWLPAPRSPYSLDDTPLDGAESPLVRPYLVAVEQERARQPRRRTAPVLAADFGIGLGIDLGLGLGLGQHAIGAEQAVAC